jgi:Fungal Zn(2)-Cys(6) binuclear cluster domain
MSAAAAAAPASAVKPLSCANCRQRKIKCDRNPPRCTQCTRSDLECVFPSRKRTQRPRRMRHNELLNRISRLENIVGEADSSVIGALGRDAFERMQASNAASSGAAAGDSAKASFIGTAAQGSGAAGGPTARFMSGEFWSNLCDEVEGLKAALDQSSDSDENETGDEDTPESTVLRDVKTSPIASSSFVLGNPGSDAEAPIHPSPDQIFKLIETYFINVDPLLKILHRPTAISSIHEFVSAGSPGRSASPSMNALFLAMYFGAVTSSPADLCLSTFGEEKSVLVERYRNATERALALADYLNSSDIATLQAFTIYVVSPRDVNL